MYRPGNLEKTAGTVHPKVQEWLKSYKPSPNQIVMLVNALGASEYWGQNVNGDVFPWAALIHECSPKCQSSHPVDDLTRRQLPVYGYQTFLNAHPFMHHQNKDPSRAFGKVALSVLNHKMKRVELVVILDKNKARQFGAQRIIDRIEAGEYPDVSMGCRVPWDQCTICGHKSRTRKDYCSCVRELGMNKVLDDGRKVGVINWYPRFFDISFVFIGADKTAKCMAKLASGLWVPMSVAEGYEVYGEAEEGLVKAACGRGGRCNECPGGCHWMEKTASVPGFYEGTIAAQLITQAEKPEGRKVTPSKVKKLLKKFADAKMGPPPSPNRKEYPYVGTINFRGLKIYVENNAGDYREGTGPGGKVWRTLMKYPYGEILGTKGTDKDRLDVYVGPNADAKNVYVVHQNHPGNHPTKAGKYDEDKAMVGFDSVEDATKAYLEHYDRKDFLRSVTAMSFPMFKSMIMGEVKGEKVAHSLEKTASDMKLEDLFNKKASTRLRIWKDSDHNVIGQVDGSGFTKTAGLVEDGISAILQDKTAAKKKVSEILKRVDPSGTTGQVADLLSEREADLPKEVLDRLGNGDLSKALSTASGMGIALKPSEFQRVLLVRIGRKDLADDLGARGVEFPPVSTISQPCSGLSPEGFAPSIMRALLPFLESRSYLKPVVSRRIIRISVTPVARGESKMSDSPLLTKIGSAYNWYRNEMTKVALQADRVVSSVPELNAALHGVDESDFFTMKVAQPKEVKLTGRGAIAAASTIPLMLMVASNLRDEEEAGQQIGFIEKLIAHHPYLASMGTVAGARELMKTNIGLGALDKALKFSKDTLMKGMKEVAKLK
jgi:hypothetical protein